MCIRTPQTLVAVAARLCFRNPLSLKALLMRRPAVKKRSRTATTTNGYQPFQPDNANFRVSTSICTAKLGMGTCHLKICLSLLAIADWYPQTGYVRRRYQCGNQTILLTALSQSSHRMLERVCFSNITKRCKCLFFNLQRTLGRFLSQPTCLNPCVAPWEMKESALCERCRRNLREQHQRQHSGGF